MMWTRTLELRLRAACRATLLARPPHPTRVEIVRVTFAVELRDGTTIRLTEETWT